ncbi:DHHW family protein [Bacillus sp. Hm123]|uniref:DHHW family protein n=1 Tax=Bacillus sp. Hm123 TaxID=3450745 RepID=UPI003F442103
MQSLIKKVTICIALSFIFGMSAITILSDKTDFSEAENRNFEKMPKLTKEALFNGTYMLGIENYFKDHFFQRTPLTKWYFKLEQELGKPKVNNLLMGEDDWLGNSPSPKKGSYGTVDYIYLPRIDFIANHAKENDIVVEYFLLPAKNYSVDELFPRNSFFRFYEEYMDALGDRINPYVRFTNVKEVWDKEKSLEERKKLFFKTDHHWNTDGAYEGYKVIINQLNSDGLDVGQPILKEDLAKYCAKEDDYFVGSNNRFILYNVEPTDELKCMYELKDLKQFTDFHFEPWAGAYSEDINALFRPESDSNRVNYSNLSTKDHPYIYFENKNSGNNKKVLIFKDSYSNANISYLASHFQETHILDMRYYQKDVLTLIEDEDINLILMLHNSNGLNGDVILYDKNSKHHK